MPSVALDTWMTDCVGSLDEIENAHASVGGTGRGRRFATQQINHAYAVLLSSQFQRFCRDLHSESVDHLVLSVTPVAWQLALRAEFTDNRLLDKGNPHPGGIGRDFNRLGLVFWDDVNALDQRNPGRRNQLDDLNAWRNAIAHQDFTAPALGGAKRLQIRQVRRWRSTCHSLATSFDKVMRDHVLAITGNQPWA